MGTLCSCFHIRDLEEDTSSCPTCTCLSCIIRNLVHKHAGILSNEQSDASVSTVQVNTQLDSATAPPGTMRFEADATSPSQQQDEQIREHNNNQEIGMEHASKGNVSAEPQSEGRTTACCSDPRLKLSSGKSEAKVAPACEDEDEDVCPTCLEEYIPDNPKIVLTCSHSYHLGCIYEWMERSENCPVCGQVMVFNEAA